MKRWICTALVFALPAFGGDGEKHVSWEELAQQLVKKIQLVGIKQSVAEYQDSLARSGGRRLSPLETDIEYGHPTGSEEQRRISVSLMQPIRVGSFSRYKEEEAAQEAAALLAAEKDDITTSLATLGKGYVDLMFYQEQLKISSDLDAFLKPFMGQVQKARQQGIIQPLALSRWELFYRRVLATGGQAKQSFAAAAGMMSQMTGTDIAQDALVTVFAPLQNSWSEKSVDLLAPLKAARAKKEALQAKAEAARRQTEFKLGVGYEKTMEKNAEHDGAHVLAKLSYPLGQGFIQRTEAQEAAAAAKIQGLHEERLKERLKAELELQRQKLAQKRQWLSELTAWRDETAGILSSARSAMFGGAVGAQDVFESLERFADLQWQVAEARRDLNHSTLEAMLLMEVFYAE